MLVRVGPDLATCRPSLGPHFPKLGQHIPTLSPQEPVEIGPNLGCRSTFSTTSGPGTAATTQFCDHGMCLNRRSSRGADVCLLAAAGGPRRTLSLSTSCSHSCSGHFGWGSRRRADAPEFADRCAQREMGKFLKAGRVVVLLQGRYAGKKAAVIDLCVIILVSRH